MLTPCNFTVMEKDRTMKQLPFNLGVKCLEKSVVEVDSAVRDFSASSATALTLYSWKFPHLKLEKLEVNSILRNLRHQNLASDIHYLHLTELLIDRLYFSMLTAIRFVSTLTSIAADGNGDTTFFGDIGPDGDFLSLSVVNPLCSDPKVFNTNMGLVVRHLQNALADLESLVHYNVTKLHKYQIMGVDEAAYSVSASSSSSSLAWRRSAVTQTEITSIECCEICSLSQESIKNLGETLESCLATVCPNDHSAVTLTRVDITKNLFTNTQWSVVTRWCEALSIDLEVITTVARDHFKRAEGLELDLKKTVHQLNTNTRDHAVALQKLEKKCTSLETALQVKKKETLESLELQRFLEDKLATLELTVQHQEADLKQITDDKASLQQILNSLEKSHQELKYSQTTHSQTLRRIQQDLVAEQKHKETVQGTIVGLETANRKYRLEIAKLRTDLKMVQNDRNQVESELKTVRKELVQAKTEAGEGKQEEIVNLTKDLKFASQKIELLTLYPDLNGPINTPESENEDVVRTMEKQLQGNTMRVQVLLQQSEKLAATLKKLKGSSKALESS